MLSIVVCSYKKDLLEMLRRNIEATVGVPYELIVIDNSNGSYGICKAYNDGGSKAKYDIICFVHEDVAFETIDWGKKAIQHLADPGIGLIGVAGGDTKSFVPSSWSSYIFGSEVHLVQHFKNSPKPPLRISATAYYENPRIKTPVACIDGVWICTRKEVFQKHKFDPRSFPGFHGYDIDYSLQVAQEYRNFVVSDIILHHFSEGSFDKTWLKNNMRISDKWKRNLPYTVRDMTKEQLVHQHWVSMRNFLKILFRLNYNSLAITRYFIKYSNHKYFHFKNFLHFSRIVIKYSVGIKRKELRENDWI